MGDGLPLIPPPEGRVRAFLGANDRFPDEVIGYLPLYGINCTTAPVFPAFVVNGPVRHDLDIPFAHGCFGGAATQAVAIGRALRLIMRNIADQVPGVTSRPPPVRPAV